MRLVIVGDGKMGKAIAVLAEDRGHVVHGIVGRGENTGGGALTRERLEGVDVALEFTRPDAAPENVRRLIEAGIPTVSGTTGWDMELPKINGARAGEARGVPLRPELLRRRPSLSPRREGARTAIRGTG